MDAVTRCAVGWEAGQGDYPAVLEAIESRYSSPKKGFPAIVLNAGTPSQCDAKESVHGEANKTMRRAWNVPWRRAARHFLPETGI